MDLGVAVSGVEYELAVIKDPTDPLGDRVVIDDDLVPPVEPVDPVSPGGTVDGNYDEYDESNDNTVTIVLGIVFGILGALCIGIIGFYFW